VALIERFGQFSRLAQPGCNMIIMPCEQRVGMLSFRVQQLNVTVETKTLDNVFLVAVVSVQYQVLRDKTYEAFYSLTNPKQQITAHVYDVRVVNYIIIVAVAVVAVVAVILYVVSFSLFLTEVFTYSCIV
jgi:regulator of protease activity HflC (stomatin/prohibitin superfamily)